MITSIHSVTGQETRISSEITQEVEFLSSTLSLLRDSEKISNDEFLEAGLIQGGLNLLSAMISNGVEAEELEIQITSLKDRALLICQRFPNMDFRCKLSTMLQVPGTPMGLLLAKPQAGRLCRAPPAHLDTRRVHAMSCEGAKNR